MCHGTFDLVHPGHVRHLLYAKNKADVLVASLTKRQPHHEGELPPLCAARPAGDESGCSWRRVDYVVIDNDPHAAGNIGSSIRARLFRQGLRVHRRSDSTPAPAKRWTCWASMAAKSFSHRATSCFRRRSLSSTTPPNIANDKLHTLMESEGITLRRSPQSVRRSRRGRRSTCWAIRSSTRTSYCQPLISSGLVPSRPHWRCAYESQVDYAGGAAVVAKHLRAAGANVDVLDACWATTAGRTSCSKDMEEWGIDCRHGDRFDSLHHKQKRLHRQESTGC